MFFIASLPLAAKSPDPCSRWQLMRPVLLATCNVLQGAFFDGRNNVLQWTCIAILAETMLLLKGWHPLPLVTNVLHSPLVQGQLILLIPLMIKGGGDISHFVLLLVLFGLNTFLTISSDLFHFPGLLNE